MAVIGGLQKATIVRQDLPPLSVFPDGTIGHYVRHRIISEDRNRYSSWSNVKLVRVPAFDYMGITDVTFTAGSVSAVWGDEYNRPKYDVFVRWGNSTKKVKSVGTLRTIETDNIHGFNLGDKILVENININYNGFHTITAVNAEEKTLNFIIEDNPQTQVLTIQTGEVLQEKYEYHGTTSVHSYAFLRRSYFDLLHVDIQVESIEKTYSSDLLIYDSPSIVLA